MCVYLCMCACENKIDLNLFLPPPPLNKTKRTHPHIHTPTNTNTTSSGGEKVMAAEVERALLAHPRVAQAAVVGAPDPGKLGERVVAFVVLRKGKEGEEHSSRSSSSSSSSPAGGGDVGEALRAWCRGRLAGYKVPKEVRAVASLPTTASGKVMKGRLKEEVVGTGVGARRSFL